MKVNSVSDPVLEAIENIRISPGAAYNRMKKDQVDKAALLVACERLLGAMACDELNNGQVFDDDLRKEVKEYAIAVSKQAKEK